ncbi:efflux RND transporter periplasmic adaptor subunit [Salinisphaera sp. G21_0]|uniref:efflux RND transporter periplasmic adaptor subunit n=1 Tax=Salinisphaera sp. G21_0 TaxID=2821094 RepID=UPI001ADB6578|nr:efflux RND transporter periplasmic adaptor subunit [Salinisphaera sp. G21_0]MBO9482987.1 efflux RND transporter periplasmic adaptor subunit [Salinisphaera sp. G21_0]
MKLLRLNGMLILLMLVAPVSFSSTAVTTAVVETHYSAPVHWLNGSVISRESARISAEVSGRIVWLADFGQPLKAGDLLARVDDSALTLEVDSQELEMLRAREKFEYLNKELERLQALHKKKSISKSVLDTAEHDYRIAKLDWQLATVNHKKALDQLQRTTIRAPFAGVINDRMSAAGEYVSIGDPLAQLINTGRIEVKVQVPIELSGYLDEQNLLDIRDGEKTYQSQLINRAGAADSKSRLMEVRLSPIGVNWAPGAPVKVAIPLKKPLKALRVPRDAVVMDGDGHKVVKIIRESEVYQAQPVAIEVLSGSELYVTIRGDVYPGDRIVVRGAVGLKAHDVVTLVDKALKNAG